AGGGVVAGRCVSAWGCAGRGAGSRGDGGGGAGLFLCGAVAGGGGGLGGVERVGGGGCYGGGYGEWGGVAGVVGVGGGCGCGRWGRCCCILRGTFCLLRRHGRDGWMWRRCWLRFIRLRRFCWRRGCCGRSLREGRDLGWRWRWRRW